MYEFLRKTFRSIVEKNAGRLARYLCRFLPGSHIVPDIYGRSAHKLIDIRDDVRFSTYADTVIRHGRSYLYYDRLYTIYQALNNVQRHAQCGLSLNIMEVGVFRGGGSYFIADVASGFATTDTMMFSVDTFSGHSKLDVLTDGRDGDHTTGSFTDTSYESVCDYLKPFSFVKVVNGRIQDVEGELSAIFHFIHLDVDIYEPTRYVLEFCFPRMPAGGTIVVDDYGFKSCPGAKKAVDEFVESRQDVSFYSYPTGQAMLVKII